MTWKDLLTAAVLAPSSARKKSGNVRCEKGLIYSYRTLLAISSMNTQAGNPLHKPVFGYPEHLLFIDYSSSPSKTTAKHRNRILSVGDQLNTITQVIPHIFTTEMVIKSHIVFANLQDRRLCQEVATPRSLSTPFLDSCVVLAIRRHYAISSQQTHISPLLFLLRPHDVKKDLENIAANKFDFFGTGVAKKLPDCNITALTQFLLTTSLHGKSCVELLPARRSKETPEVYLSNNELQTLSGFPFQPRGAPFVC
jgi:hypothetical protein